MRGRILRDSGQGRRRRGSQSNGVRRLPLPQGPGVRPAQREPSVGARPRGQNRGLGRRVVLRFPRRRRSVPVLTSVSPTRFVFRVTTAGSVAGSYDGCVYFLSADSGETKWVFQTEDAVKSSAAVDPLTGLVVVGSHDGHIYALDPQVSVCLCSHLLCYS